jgi:guanylate kinase
MNEAELGRLIIISGPSGAGKSTIVRRLLNECPLPLELSISATTRQPRPGEVDRRDYFFISDNRFAELRTAGAFLECKEVFGRGIWYGTLAERVKDGLAAGKWVILEIDVEGAAAVLSRDISPITIFLHPGGMDELERRLRSRGTESEAAIERRLEVARGEMEALPRYDHEIINRQLDATVEAICQLLQSYARTPKANPHRPCIGCDS